MNGLPEKPAGLRVVAIAAMSENRVIGNANAIPWSLPDDMKWFRESTRGKVLLMGRKTCESIGRALPKRRTLVLTRSPTPLFGLELVRGFGEAARIALESGDDELWICGGAEVYAWTLPWWDELLLTRVKQTVEGDAFFPEFENRLRPAGVILETSEMRIERHVTS